MAPSALPMAMATSSGMVARAPDSARRPAVTGIVTDLEDPGPPTSVQVSHGIAAYARVQGGALATAAQPAQDIQYAAYGSG
jgi:hypothetical protein